MLVWILWSRANVFYQKRVFNNSFIPKKIGPIACRDCPPFSPDDPLHPMLSIPGSDVLFPCWKSQSFHLHSGGVSYFTTQAMSSRGSFRARPLNGFEISSNLAENRIEYVLMTSWDGNSIFFSANWARPGSQKLPWNGFTEWNFLRNKEKTHQNRGKITLGGGGEVGSSKSKNERKNKQTNKQTNKPVLFQTNHQTGKDSWRQFFGFYSNKQTKNKQTRPRF